MSFLQQVQVQLAGLPIVLVCLSNGCVVFVPTAKFSMVLCPPSKHGVDAVLCEDCFRLQGSGPVKEFEYNQVYNYREHPLMLQWLQELNLQNPITGEFRNECR